MDPIWLLPTALPLGFSARLLPIRHKSYALAGVIAVPIMFYLGAFLYFRLANPSPHDGAYFQVGLMFILGAELIWAPLALLGYGIARLRRL